MRSTPVLATEAVEQSPIPMIRSLSVTESEAEVVLSGCVGSYYMKQLAQETVRRVLGQRRLLNQITVLRPTA